VRSLGALVVGALIGALGVLIASRSEAGQRVLAKVSATLESFLDGAVEGFRESSR
jgi:hypothetical protein